MARELRSPDARARAALPWREIVCAAAASETLADPEEPAKAQTETAYGDILRPSRSPNALARQPTEVERTMDVKNAVVPEPEQIQSLSEPGRGGPIFMVNLLKFKDRAEYPDGRETDLTGRQAYDIYGQQVIGHLAAVGGKPVFAGDVTQLLLGEVEELWDEVAIAMYPDRAAMRDMIMNPAYQQSAIHRSAGLAGQLNIETVVPSGFDLSNPE
jgi:uncharacterized protein (DUF1330 family)